MAISKDTALRLVLVTDLVNEAEATVSRLRNAGIAVRPTRPESLDELAQALAQQQPVDMVLADYASTQMPFEQVATMVMGCGKDVPLLAVLDGITDDILENVQAMGAQAVALRERPQQFLKNVQTEWQDLDARRSQRKLEAQMRETQRRCDMLIDSSREPIAYIHQGMHIRANQAYLEMFGFESFDDIEGMSLLDLVAPGNVDAFRALLKDLAKGEPPPPRYELTAVDSEGGEFPAVMEFSAAEYQGESCQQIIFRHQAVEVDPELERELAELRERDQATGLLNRQTFLKQLEDSVVDAGSNQGQYGFLLFEPDNYQRTLQGIGLDSVDQLLKAMADCLRETLAHEIADGSAKAARFADHSFAVLARGDHAMTKALAERIRAAYSARVFEVGGGSSTFTISIGGAQIGEKTANVSQVLDRASQGMQSSASVGGNRIDIFDPGAVDRAEAERIQAWVERLRDALANDHFLFHYQPVIPLLGAPGGIYETFLQLDTGDGERVTDLSFMQIAADHGLLGEIDRWKIGRAIEIAAKRANGLKSVRLMVKLNQASLVDESLPGFIKEQLSAHGVSGNCLLLQVPESKAFINLVAVQALATEVGKLGCQMVLEQFGAGIDSLQLLSHFKPGFIKLDPSFMEDLSKSIPNQQKVQELTHKARELGILGIAAGVQDANSMSSLFTSGIDYVEGDFLAQSGPDMNYEFES